MVISHSKMLVYQRVSPGLQKLPEYDEGKTWKNLQDQAVMTGKHMGNTMFSWKMSIKPTQF